MKPNPTHPINKDILRSILEDFMQSIEEWESEIEGSPTRANFADLDAIYDETIDALDKEYLK